MYARQPLCKRAESDVKKSAVDDRDERDGEVLAVADCLPKKIAEVNREADFDQRKERFQRHVTTGSPALPSVFDPILRRALEFGAMIENRFDYCARVVDR